jgi:hypothetical protein
MISDVSQLGALTETMNLSTLREYAERLTL